MRFFLSLALLVLIFGTASAQEASPAPAEPTKAPEGARPSRSQPSGTPLAPVEDPAAHAKRLDDLFAQLKGEPSSMKAGILAGRINAEWAKSGSATADLLVQRATLAMAKEDNGAAMDFLDQALVLKPDFAEAWNRRATLNYSIDDYGKSLADIRATLNLEPRHYGALMGLAAILEETGRRQEALTAYSRVLTIYPTLKTAQDAVGRLSDELTGQAL